ncbi:magnesium transporter [Candidatus Bathyarchaeota archaeon]|nr:magnesium transporter [Candidatus Bathyarchaeota archaeon]MBS7631093.1 magnesium transporter [Candidatus Bathyarchaeota archaeon]
MVRYFNKGVFIEALSALTFDFLGLFSGRIALLFSPFFQSSLWILALYPPILTIRGNIGGVYSGNMSTMLHIGEVEPRFKNNTKKFYSLLESMFILTFIDSFILSMLAYLLNFFLGKTDFSQLQFFVTVPPLTCLLGISLALPLATYVANEAFKRGANPDILLYPVMSTLDDIIITISYIGVVYLTFISGSIIIMFTALFLLGIFFTYIFLKNRKDEFFRRILKEGSPSILFSSILGVLGGVGLANLKEKIENTPAILVLYPALIDALGDLGSIVGSLETTNLALGYTSKLSDTLRMMFSDVIAIGFASIILHFFLGVATYYICLMTGLSADPITIIRIAIFSNILSFTLISILSLLVSTQTFKHGLDPDNFTIPVIASSSDLIATITLLLPFITPNL